jgi:hypothetical protein
MGIETRIYKEHGVVFNFTTPFDHYYLSLMWMYLDTSILETSNSVRREYFFMFIRIVDQCLVCQRS